MIRTICALALAAVLSAASPLAAEAAPRTIRTAYTTGYTFFDNTPPGSPAISHPVRHQHASGVGTYRNPITIAVGHRIRHGRDHLDYRAGTRMYLPHVRRYFIVEDTCGDGPRPQRGPCHDLDTAPRRAVQRCASKITDGDGHQVHRIVVHPRRGLPVVRGPLFHDGHCTRLYGS